MVFPKGAREYLQRAAVCVQSPVVVVLSPENPPDVIDVGADVGMVQAEGLLVYG